MALTWESRYRIGHLTVDDDRKLLFEIATEFSRARDLHAAKSALSKLMTIAKSGFQREEYIMHLCKVPAATIAFHRQCHGVIEQHLRDIVIDEIISNTRTPDHVFIVKTAKLLEMWIFNHILKDDLTLKPFIQEHIRARDRARKASGKATSRARPAARPIARRA